jgi:hypothetical protein
MALMPSFIALPWQSWKSAKAMAFLIVLAIAIGVGSITAVFAVIYGLLLKPVPYKHGERFVSVLGAHLDDPSGMAAFLSRMPSNTSSAAAASTSSAGSSTPTTT